MVGMLDLSTLEIMMIGIGIVFVIALLLHHFFVTRRIVVADGVADGGSRGERAESA